MGRWITLTITAKDVGLEGRRLDGIGFAVDDGQVFWGKTSRIAADGKETVLIDGSLDNLAPPEEQGPGTWLVKYQVPGAKGITVRCLVPKTCSWRSRRQHFSRSLNHAVSGPRL